MSATDSNTWQNNLVLSAFFVTSIGTAIVVVFTIYVVFNSSPDAPGHIAIPVLLACLGGILAVLTGVAIERESVRKRLPKVRVKQVVVGFLIVVLVFGVKSFFFGLGMCYLLMMCTFLFKEFESRVRGIAVCGAMICVVVAEAIRRAGGYDSGGISRVILIMYSFSAFFLSGLLMITTLKRLPRATIVACVGFGILAFHSGGIMIAGMATVLEEAFEGKSMSQSKAGENEHGYCIISSIASPVGLIVEAFQTAIFPPWSAVATETTTTAIVTTTSATTTTFDCSLLGAIFEDEENYTNGTNGSSGTRITRYSRSFHGIDLSHCIQIDNLLETNTTFTTSTSTTATTTSSSTSTTTTTLTTTSTTTTSTTTSTTTTSTSTSSTTSTSTTSSENETTTVTFTNTSVLPAYVMTAKGEYCVDEGTDILEEAQCRGAASSLGLIFHFAYAGAGEHKKCFFADDNRSKVYYNFAEMPAPRPNRRYKSVCHRVSPYDFTVHCGPGMAETEVSGAGQWAIAVFALAGVWSTALWFAISLVLIARSRHPKVHPEADARAPKPTGLVALEDQAKAVIEVGARVEAECDGEWKIGTVRSETGGEYSIQLDGGDLTALTRNVKLVEVKKKKRCKKCCRCGCCVLVYHLPCCKKLIHVLVLLSEGIIGISAFGFSFIALVVAGATQLPMEQPKCASDPVSFDWIFDEPVERFSVVWCEMGALSAVLLSFLAFSDFVLCFSMSLRKVLKHRHEEHVRTQKVELQRIKTAAVVNWEPVEKESGFRVKHMIPKEDAPVPIWSDYDGRVFDV